VFQKRGKKKKKYERGISAKAGKNEGRVKNYDSKGNQTKKILGL